MNLTDAERAKRYSQRKAGKQVEKTSRAARRREIEALWCIAHLCGEHGSLRTFYRRRAAVLWFARHATDEQLNARVRDNPKLAEFISGHTLLPEWSDFIARLEALDIPVDRRHPLDAMAEGSSP
jgi:hypothetical protein